MTKKITECKKRRLIIKLPNITLTAKPKEETDLKEGDLIKLSMSQNINMICKVTSDQERMTDIKHKITAEEISTVGKVNLKGVFKI